MSGLRQGGDSKIRHIPALISEILSVFPKSFCPRKILDCSFGRGGHSLALLERFPAARIAAIDRDQEALAYGASLDPVREGKIQLIHGNFHDFAGQGGGGRPFGSWISYRADRPAACGAALSQEPALTGPPAGAGREALCPAPPLPAGFCREKFDIILIDLGASSPQLDQAERGFSFYQDGPLDMRMDRAQKLTAADIINRFSEKDLARLFQEYGEIKNPFPAVKAVLRARRKKPVQTTGELALLIQKRGGRRPPGRRLSGRHPATAYFLALRMKVNNELEGLRQSLPGLLEALSGGGHFLVVSFHSLEDRIVKRAFRSFEKEGRGEILNKKVIRPSLEEIKRNPRSRSARLRGFAGARLSSNSPEEAKNHAAAVF